MEEDVLWGFFSGDEARIVAAMRAIDQRSSGAVTSIDTLVPNTGDDGLRPARNGIFCQKIFGPVLDHRCACGTLHGQEHAGETCDRCGVLCDRSSLRAERWGHVEVLGVVHPLVYERLTENGVGAALGIDHDDLRAIAFGEKPLADLIGPSALAEALRRTAPDHPLLPLCAITKVPIPPPDRRPFAPREGPTQVDPWIGRTNEVWIALVERAYRQRRLAELGAPDIIMRHEDVATQSAYVAAMDATRRDARRLLPPLAFVPERLEERDARALAFVSGDRLIVQRRDAVSLVDLASGEHVKLPPCGARLRGVVGGRYAVFDGIFTAAHPMMDVAGCGFGDEVFDGEGEGRWFRAGDFLEVSIVDCDTGTYLTRPPPEVHLRFFRNDEPEDLFLEDEDQAGRRRIASGGDRPEVFAYAPGMRHGWVGSAGVDESMIVDTDKGRPHAYVACLYDDVPELRLLDETQEESEDAVSAVAVAFSEGAWHVLGHDGILRDHRGREAVRLVPMPELAAFDPTGRILAVMIGERIVRVDVARRAVIS